MQDSHNLYRPLEVKLAIPVRSYDIDFAGIVSNIVYIRWLEDLRSKLLDEHLPLAQQVEQGYTPILTGTQIEYKRAIKLFDRVVGHLWISNLGRIKWTVQAEIITDNKLAATAIQTGTLVSLHNGRPVSMPEELLQKYSEYQQDKNDISN